MTGAVLLVCCFLVFVLAPGWVLLVLMAGCGIALGVTVMELVRNIQGGRRLNALYGKGN